MWEESEVCARRDSSMQTWRKRLLGWLFHVHESNIHPAEESKGRAAAQLVFYSCFPS